MTLDLGGTASSSGADKDYTMPASYYAISDSRLVEFDFDTISGDIFLKNAGAPGVVDRHDEYLQGGLGMNYSISNLSYCQMSCLRVAGSGGGFFGRIV
ncbi:MAG: hypothetical protein O3C17_23980, partial [Planctomycetota bacterium]|nr:hypothetical protein [Planctomycetota bacterium]